MKKIIVLVLVICMSICMTVCVNAEEKKVISYKELSKDITEIISEDAFDRLPYAVQLSIYEGGINQPISSATVTGTKFISGYNSFKTYIDVNFSEGRAQSPSRTCVPIAVANVLSYFDYRGYSKLISGSSMSQSEFSQICSDCGWNYANIALSKGISGMKKYANRKGYTVTSYYIGSNWNNLKTYIGYNSPVIAGDGEHAYTILGYGTENGVNKVYTQIGVQDAVGAYLWVDWSLLSGAYSFVIN